MPRLTSASREIEKTLGKAGRILVRWSGTEPKLRIMIEGEDESKISTYAKELARAAQKDAAGAQHEA